MASDQLKTRLRRCLTIFPLLISCALAPACGKSDSGQSEETTAAAADTQVETSAKPADTEAKPETPAPLPAKPANPVGRLAEGNNAELVELVAAFEPCTTKPAPSMGCSDALEPFQAAAATDKAANAATILNFLEDETPYVRFAAALLMTSDAGIRISMADHHDRLLAAAKAETSALVGEQLGRAVNYALDNAGPHQDSLLELVENHPLPEMRAGVVNWYLLRDNADKFLEPLHQRLLTDDSTLVKRAVLTAFWQAPVELSKSICPFYEQVLGEDLEVATKVVYNLFASDTGACRAHYDAFITSFEERVKAGSVDDHVYIQTTADLIAAKGATRKQRTRYLTSLEGVVANTQLDDMTRATALILLGEHSRNAKKIARKYVDDPGGQVSGHAQRSVE